jgi:hypothetical protein
MQEPRPINLNGQQRHSAAELEEIAEKIGQPLRMIYWWLLQERVIVQNINGTLTIDRERLRKMLRKGKAETFFLTNRGWDCLGELALKHKITRCAALQEAIAAKHKKCGIGGKYS